MTLLLLLTSSGGPKPVVAEINAFSDVDAAATLSPPAQAAAAVTAITSLDALLRVATDRAAEIIYVTSGVTATLTNSTLAPSASIPGVGSASADAESRAADLASALIPASGSAAADAESRAADLAAAAIPAVASFAASLDNTTVRLSSLVQATGLLLATARSSTLRTAALIPGLAEVYIRIPPRSLGGVASAGAGRSATGSMTGSGRGVAGTATSASGR